MLKLNAYVAFVVLAVVLASCGSSGTAPPQAIQPLTQRLGLYSPPSRFEATRAQIAATGVTGPLLRVVVREPRMQSAGYIATGTANGVNFFTANDGSNVVLANGLLRSTVRFLGDMEGADTAPIARAIAVGGGRYSRVVRHRRGEGNVFETRLTCELARARREQIVILERRHAVQRYEETCRTRGEDPAGRIIGFRNVYWLENGVIRASEQWVSPDTGQIRIELVLP